MTIFVVLVLSSSVIASEVTPGLSDITSKPFRIDETLKVTLDGTPEASEIDRQSVVQNRLVFVGEHEWRVKRQLPFTQSVKEILAHENSFYTMSPANKKVPLRKAPGPHIWDEVILSPLQLAKEWSLAEPSETFDDFVKRLKKSQSPLKNVEGDKIEFSFLGETGIRIISSGKILQDGKTRVRVEATWELKERGNVNATSLLASLLRSD
jgi:hypothetical protein